MAEQHQKHSVTANAQAIPMPVWATVGAAVLMAAVGGMGLLAGQPWLFPSLGPTAFLQVVNPNVPSARFYNTVVGHSIGLAAGFLAVALVGARDAPSVPVSHELTAPRVLAATLALALTVLIGILTKANHPPAGATTLLVALGAFKTAHDAVNVMIAVLILALLGEFLRRLRTGEHPFSTQRR